MGKKIKNVVNTNPFNDFFVIDQKSNINEIPEHSIVGFVANDDESFKINIEMDTQYMESNNKRNMLFCVDPDNYSERSLILVTREYYKQLVSNDCLKTMIWHEIGHFHTIPLMQPRVEQNWESAHRGKAIMEGEILPEERVADLFAVLMTSKSDFVSAMKYSISNRRKLEWDDNRFLAIKEMRRRIRYVESIEDDDILLELKKLAEMYFINGVPEWLQEEIEKNKE